MASKHRLLIGGIGDDAHSVGIWLLALGFREEGFLVRNLGIRNEVADFMREAGDFDLVMISNNNGHAELYLQDFGRLLAASRLSWNSEKLWYLGGNLSVSESDFEIKKKFIGLGFTGVFPKPVDFRQVLDEVRRDLRRCNVREKEVGGRASFAAARRAPCDLSEVSDAKWSEARLARERRAVVAEWETGRDIDVEATPRPPLSPEKSLDSVLWRAKLGNRLPLLQPRTGVANLDRQVEILTYLEGRGMEIASAQLDAASRSKLYEKARLGVELSEERKRSSLNGFPAPIHGVPGVRKITEAVNVPFQLRAGGPDHRFSYEIVLQGGASGVEGGFLCYLLPYDKLTTPVESLRFWQYVDRLSALYLERHGLSVNREYFGTLTANLIEPALALVVNIVQAILSAEQGVKSLSLGYAEQGHRAQDIAAVQTLEALARKYLLKYGHGDCRVTTVFHQYMAAFPRDEARAEELIFNSAVTAAMAGATKMMTKTHVEAFKIPQEAENARGLDTARRGAQAAARSPDTTAAVSFEKELLALEVTQIMDSIEELGHGSMARGAIRAVEEGYLDIPFSPNVYNRGEVVTCRDCSGAVRFADCGNLPFNSYLKDFHQARKEERMALERDTKIFSLLEKDLSRVWKSDYRAWPLDNHYVE